MMSRTLETGWADPFEVPTFAARGVLVPFTSPGLTGVYVHRSQGSLSLRRWGGAGGALMWEDILALCRVTLHDRMLYRTLAILDDLSPWHVRRAARAVAESGAAGRLARTAARMADAKDEEDRRITSFLLIVRLLQDFGIEGLDWQHLGPFDAEFQGWLLASAERLAPAMTSGQDGLDRIDRGSASALSILGWVEALAGRIAPLGLPHGPFIAWQEGVVEQIAAFADSAAAYAVEETAWSGPGDPVVAMADALAAMARYVVGRIDAAMGAYLASVRDISRLFADWPAQQNVVCERVARVEWLIDGWAPVCRLWEEAAANGRLAQRAAMEALWWRVPVMPGEVIGWSDDAPPVFSVPAAPLTGGQPGFGLTGGGDLEQVFRNEILRAHAA